MKRIFLAILLILLCLTTACAKHLEEPEGVQVTEFTLGEASFTEQDKKVSFPLDGLLGIPEGENSPVVFILHGSHRIDDVTEDRYYKGFEYLVSALASQGYFTVSLNINRAYSFEPFEGNEQQRVLEIFQEYYFLIEKANSGEAIFDYDLKGKADLSKVNLIGHSRGGSNSLYLANYLRQEQKLNVQSVIAVASTFLDESELSLDIPVGIVSSQYDGDVVSLDGLGVYNHAYTAESQRKSPIVSGFLYQANHNNYNSYITGGDTLAPPEGVTYISDDLQREFLAKFVKDFLDIVNKPSGDKYKIIQTFDNNTPKRYGTDFMPSVYMVGQQLVRAENNLANITPNGMQVSYVEVSNDVTKNTAAPFNPPGIVNSLVLPLYDIAWSAAGAELVIDVNKPNWQDYKYLSLLIANNPTKEINNGIKPLEFELSLVDIEGKSSSYKLSSEVDSALRYIKTDIENVFANMEGFEPFYLAKNHTPLGTQTIDLSLFQEVDLSQIKYIKLTSISIQGAIILGSIDLY